jgi:hypothetical protein
MGAWGKPLEASPERLVVSNLLLKIEGVGRQVEELEEYGSRDILETKSVSRLE